MRALSFIAALIVAAPVCGGSKSPTPAATPQFTRLKPKPTGGTLVAQLKSAQARAESEGRRLFVELGAEWCWPCVAVERGLADPRLAEAFAGTVVVKVDIDDKWGEQLAEVGLDDGTVPIWYEIGANGRPTGYQITGGAWGEDTVENMAPILKRFFHRQGPGDRIP